MVRKCKRKLAACNYKNYKDVDLPKLVADMGAGTPKLLLSRSTKLSGPPFLKRSHCFDTSEREIIADTLSVLVD